MDSKMELPVKFTESQIYNLIEFIEVDFIETIRRDETLDNIDYIIDMMEALKKLREIYKQFKN